jgi:predicted nucleotidyltransferase
MSYEGRINHKDTENTKRGRSGQYFMDLCFFLEDLFGRRVDLVTPESLSPHFGEKILQEVEYVWVT